MKTCYTIRCINSVLNTVTETSAGADRDAAIAQAQRIAAQSRTFVSYTVWAPTGFQVAGPFVGAH